jgi:hypothetical protein
MSFTDDKIWLSPLLGSDEFNVKEIVSFLPLKNLEIELVSGYVNEMILSPPNLASARLSDGEIAASSCIAKA